MTRLHRFSLRTLLAGTVLLAACSGKENDITGPGPGPMNATIAGNVVLGTSALSARTTLAIGLAGVMVRATGSGQSATTDANGDFVLKSLPGGSTALSFDRDDIHASGNVFATPGGTTQVTVSIVGNQAVITAGGHVGEEIEGLIQSVDAAGGKLVVADQRLGTVTVTTDAATVIRHGGTALTLAMLVAGQRVHVKAMKQADGTYLATEIILQDQGTGGERVVTGTIASIDPGTQSFVVTTATGSVKVTTDTSTAFRSRGKAITFAELATGQRVTVDGTQQSDGSLLASRVNVEG